MLARVLSAVCHNGTRYDPGDTLDLPVRLFDRLVAVGAVVAEVEAGATDEARAEGDAFVSSAAAQAKVEAEAERARALEAEAAKADPLDLLDALDREGLKAFAREHALDDVNLRLGEENLREEIRAAIELRAEEPDTEGTDDEPALDDDLDPDLADSDEG